MTVVIMSRSKAFDFQENLKTSNYCHILKQRLGADSHYFLGSFNVKYGVKRKLYLSKDCVLR